MCDIINYEFAIDYNPKRTIHSYKKFLITIDDLQPYHNYTFKIYHNKYKGSSLVTEKAFTTKEGGTL